MLLRVAYVVPYAGPDLYISGCLVGSAGQAAKMTTDHIKIKQPQRRRPTDADTDTYRPSEPRQSNSSATSLFHRIAGTCLLSLGTLPLLYRLHLAFLKIN